MAEKNVLDYGVKGDGFACEGEALQAVLNGGGRIYIPAGKYRIEGPLALPSHTRLRAHPEAFFFLTEGFGVGRDSYLLTNRPGAEDITVTGGIWNGNCAANPCSPDGAGDPYLGILIHFADVSGLRLSNMTVQDSGHFHICLNYVKNFKIEHITIADVTTSSLGDGIHISGGCEDGEIAHIRAVGPACPGDDMIALITDLPHERMSPRDPTWWERSGPIRRIQIRDIAADNAFSFVRLGNAIRVQCA